MAIMSGEPRLELIYAPIVKSHLKTIKPKYYSLIKKEIERLILAYSPKFQKILRAAEVQIREGKGISHEDFCEETMTKPDDPASKPI